MYSIYIHITRISLCNTTIVKSANIQVKAIWLMPPLCQVEASPTGLVYTNYTGWWYTYPMILCLMVFNGV